MYLCTLDNTQEYIGLYFERSLTLAEKLATEIKKTSELTFAFSTFPIPKFGLSVNRFITKYIQPPLWKRTGKEIPSQISSALKCKHSAHCTKNVKKKNVAT